MFNSGSKAAEGGWRWCEEEQFPFLFFRLLPLDGCFGLYFVTIQWIFP